MAGSNEIRSGGAYYELSLRDKVSKGLKRVQAALNGFAATF
jgi:hypothetical protein